MFRKILIANRGEIAVRVARTARRMGVATAAVYSDADAGAPHVKICGEAIAIGGRAPADSYLKGDRIIEAAKRTGAEAIHPGYGFLSENADFAEAVETAGLVFIGPRPATIRAMGSKAGAKDLMEKAGVPTTPGYQGEDQALGAFKRAAKRTGYPVLLKAVAGGGGKGMRVVESEKDLAEALASAQREGKSSFGGDRVLLEKYIPRARHLEVQIMGDGEGSVVHFFERDCSVQRRHQKIIEEAPAPLIPLPVRKRLLEIGVSAGRAVDYRGAGTVECLYDGREGVWFMEMNTRLQVEHPVTEAITGVDLVEWQLRIAAGGGLPLDQDEITEAGSAFEARLYAEDPDKNFTPSVGTLTMARLPHGLARVDSGIAEGQKITPYYDPMIAKIIVHGETRQAALAKLRAALSQTRIAGVETNLSFLHALASEDDFIAGDVSTRFIEEHREALFSRPECDGRVLAAALAHRLAQATASFDFDPWETLPGFRLNKPAKAAFWIEHEGEPALARMLFKPGPAFDVEIDPNAAAAHRREGAAPSEPIRFSFSLGEQLHDGYRLTFEGLSFEATVAGEENGVRVIIGAEHWEVGYSDPLSGALAHHSAEGSLSAPMPGVVALLAAEPGDAVAAGAVLMVMEAMKMEHAIKAPHDGVVKGFRFGPGDQVKEGDLLVEFEETA